MVKLTINGTEIEAEEHTTILEAAHSADIDIPTLCYLKKINVIGACRMCLVDVEGCDNLVTACNTEVKEGMVIKTMTQRVIKARKTNMELILAQHETKCVTCPRGGQCALRELANDLEVYYDLPYTVTPVKKPWDQELPLIKDNEKCIHCMRCLSYCEKVQSLGIWQYIGTGSRAFVGIEEASLSDANCALCGQCITHCPTGALHERDDSGEILKAIKDPNKVVVFQIAPAVRVGWGEMFGLTPEEATVEKLAACLKKIGVDYVFDTNFAADLTIMEEANEFLERFTHKDEYPLPMFTSCCPGWVRFLKTEYPELVPHLSTAKSPHQMFGAVLKTYMADKLNIPQEKIYCVSVMPCLAKKYESSVKALNDSGAEKDVDKVLTVREICRMLLNSNLRVESVEPQPLDTPFGYGSGAAVIFGATGGVMEAALRSAYNFLTGENPPVDCFKEVRGLQNRREKTLDINGITVRIAVTSGLGNARLLIEDILSGKAEYDFVEVMACPGGCAGGGGQPINEGLELAGYRGNALYDLDASETIRFSHENPDITMIYEEFLGKPLSEKSHHLLHTDQTKWDISMKQK